MKINLYVEKPAISGYNNIDLATQEVDLNNMDSLCEASECVELLLDETLNYVTLPQVVPLLQKLKTRIRKNGKIIITGFDFDECIKMYLNGRLSILELNSVLYSNGKVKKTGCMSHTYIRNALKDNGLSIVSTELNMGKFIIVAQRI